MIRKIAVIGSGVMGSQIAALLAGLSFDVVLLDILPPQDPTADDLRRGLNSQDPRWRNAVARRGLEKLSTLKPPPLFRNADLQRIRIGNLEDDFARLVDCDWIIEAVIEKLEVKQSLFAKLEVIVSSSNAVVTSNTSGLSVASLIAERSPRFRQRFFVTHFFNPPRYLKLLEIIPAPETDPLLLREFCDFAEQQLGKGVVVAKDTPNFIANRIGVFHFLDVIHLTEASGWPIEAVDEVLGPATAHPKSAIFRTGDIVGLDTLSFVAETVFKGCPEDPFVNRFRIPQFLQKMILKGSIGQKSGQGFYSKDKQSGAIRAIDLSSLEYRPKTSLHTPSLDRAKSLADPAERLAAVVFADDQAGEIAWPCISHALLYAAHTLPEIADDIVPVDRALRWGFNWELGPFEMWDALGVKRVVERLRAERAEIPAIVEELLGSGRESFYQQREARRFFFAGAAEGYREEAGSDEIVSLALLKKGGGIVERNRGAALIDMGDGVFCCEFHTKMNAIDGDIIAMLMTSLERTEKEGVGLLIANQGEHFSAGANLLLMLMAAQQKQWDQLEAMIRAFQGAMQRIRFSPKPVLAAPFGMAIGGGCEVVLAAALRHAAAETYMGLVEVGAGLIPAGGGCKNLLLAFEEELLARHDPKDAIWYASRDGGPFPKVAKAFELIGTARVSASAFDARELGFLAKSDRISFDREKLLHEAKVSLLEWSKDYAPPLERNDIGLPGRGGKMALVNALRDWRRTGKATDYDLVVGEMLAHVLSGGDRPCMHQASEQHLLDLEREAFLTLCGKQLTLDRMAHLLKTGKPLRN